MEGQEKTCLITLSQTTQKIQGALLLLLFFFLRVENFNCEKFYGRKSPTFSTCFFNIHKNPLYTHVYHSIFLISRQN